MNKGLNVLGLHKDPWHNSGAAIVQERADGEVRFVNLAQERADRMKDSRNFPLEAVHACMEETGIRNFSDFDLVVMDYIRNGSDWKKDFYKTPCDTNNFLDEISPEKLVLINHHLAHACNVFYSSGFQNAAVLIVDGRGSDQETQSLFCADRGNGIRLIEKTSAVGIGLLYAAVTHQIGFGLLQEGKTMGLAPYGRNIKHSMLQLPKKYQGITTDYSDVCVDGSYEMKAGILSRPESFEDKARMAFEVQEECEQALLYLANYAKAKTGSENLCFSGGVALNSVANHKILQSGIFKKIFMNPGASDSGIPLGAALYGYHVQLRRPTTYPSISPYLGPSFSEEQITRAIKIFSGYEVFKTNAAEMMAEALAENKIVGCFHGRSEMGPRALGNRSILMSPLKAENKDILNSRVKFREAFRPFAPVVLKEFSQEYFNLEEESPYMLLVPEVRPEKRSVIPAVTHVDGTGRLQTVTEDFNPILYGIVNKFYQRTGVPVLLNTSFNVAGEPIVETPEDAIRCFMKTQIDALYLQGYFLIKDSAVKPAVSSDPQSKVLH